jgi:hypothetical protein
VVERSMLCGSTVERCKTQELSRQTGEIGPQGTHSYRSDVAGETRSKATVRSNAAPREDLPSDLVVSVPKQNTETSIEKAGMNR